MRAPREDIRPTLGRTAVTLAVLAAGFAPVAYAIAALVLSIGGPSESEAKWATVLGRAAAYTGLAMAAAAFLLAVSSRLRREPIDSLWFPLALLPLLAVLVLLIYVFWVR